MVQIPGATIAAGIVSIYSTVSQGLTTTLNEDLKSNKHEMEKSRAEVNKSVFEAERATYAHKFELDRSLDRFQTESRNSISRSTDVADKELRKLSDETIQRLNEKVLQINEKIGELERLRAASEQRLKNTDSQLETSRAKLAEFENAVNEAVKKGGTGLINDPVFQKAIAALLNSDTSSKLEKLDSRISRLGRVETGVCRVSYIPEEAGGVTSFGTETSEFKRKVVFATPFDTPPHIEVSVQETNLGGRYHHPMPAPLQSLLRPIVSFHYNIENVTNEGFTLSSVPTDGNERYSASFRWTARAKE